MAPRRRTLLLEKPCQAQQALEQLAGTDTNAISEGRLFAGRRRVRDPNECFEAGQLISWNAPRESTLEARPAPKLVLERRAGFIAAAKPVAWSSEPDRTGSSTSLREQLASKLSLRQIHILTRLDVGVSGLVLAAIDASSRQHWTTLVAAACHRNYLAILAGSVADSGTWQGAVESAPTARVHVSVTHFHCLARLDLTANVTLGKAGRTRAVSLVVLQPETGHRHQLRIHTSRAGSPIVGDRRYGGPIQFTDGEGRVVGFNRIFLHAVSMTVPLLDGTVWQPSCPLNQDFRDLWLRLGGAESNLTGFAP